MGDRVAVFKATGCGDYLRDPETVTLDGEEPERASGLYADTGVLGDRGGGSVYRVELKAIVHRGASESYTGYLKRRLSFLRDLKRARGFYPPVAPFNASTAGMLAVSEDSSAATISTALVAAGSNVVIPTGTFVGVQNAERWYAFDTVSGVFTTFATVGPTSGGSVTAAVLDIPLPSGSFLFRATFVLPGAYLLPGITLEGETPGSTSATKDIPLAFVSELDPIFDGAP